VKRVFFKACRFLITGPTPEQVIERGGLLVEGDRIIAAGPSAEVGRLCEPLDDVETVDASHKIVMPGLVDAHNHVGEAHALLVEGWLDTPVSGIVDALERIYWPADGWLTDESAYDMTLFGLLNSIRHGVTTHANATPLPDAVYRASVEAGVRAAIHPQMVTSFTLHGMGEREYLAATEEAIKNYHNTQNGRIQIGVHPNTTFNCTQSLLLKGMEIAERYDVQYAVHYAETPDEVAASNTLWAGEGGLIRRWRDMGLISPRTVFFHGTLLTEPEIDVLADTGSRLVHCPATNSWFGYCAYLPYMLRAGLTVGLGTDCPTHDLFSVMLSVLQHHQIMPRELSEVDPAVIFELATVGGARVLGLDDRIGTLEPGKKADVVTIDLQRNTRLFPLNRQVLFTMLAFNGAGTEASDVMVDGRFLRRDGEFTLLDEERTAARALEWCEQFAGDYLSAGSAGRAMVHRAHDDFRRI
jgi:5-methylthioadenosine/S-adenosylhomocysteine deaminase